MPTRSLPVPLTDADRLVIQKDLTTAISALEQSEEEKRDAVRVHNGNIKGHKKRVHELNQSLVTGTVDREVETEERPDYKRRVVVIIRLDTGDACAERAMDPDERQTAFKKKIIDGGKKGDNGGADAEAEKADKIANDRAERIAARVAEERQRITVMRNKADGPLEGTLQFGGRVLTGIGGTDDEVRDAVIAHVTPLIEEQEVARDAEIAKLAAEQKADATEKPKRKRGGPKGRTRRAHQEGTA